MDDKTKAQIARVIFEAILEGRPVTEKQRRQLVEFITGKTS